MGFSLNSQVGPYRWLGLFGSSNKFNFSIMSNTSSNITHYMLRHTQIVGSSFNVNNQICVIYLTLQNTTLTGYINGQHFSQRTMNYPPWNNNSEIIFDGLLKGRSQYVMKNERILSFAGIYERALTPAEVLIASQNHYPLLDFF
jgi:hypothetical protein